MTVITTLVTSLFTVHATDSLITLREKDGTRKAVEKRGTKIVPVKRFRGAMSYWGWATTDATKTTPGWNAVRWLQEQARQADAFDSPGAFALGLAQSLEAEIRKRPATDPVARGIGIHFSCYERIGNYWVPEVFLISNYENPSYRSLRPGGVGVTRNLHVGFVGISETDILDVDRDARLCAYRILRAGTPGWWFNGDPGVFGPVAGVFMNTIAQLQDRGHLKLESWKEHADLARMPVELVSRMFKSFSIDNRIVVGGKPHDLVISPGNHYYSTTGDGI